MIIKNKNKLKLKAKSKILVLGLILVVIIGIGLFSPTEKASAAEMCYQANGVPIPLAVRGSLAQCQPPLIWSATPPVSDFQALGGAAPQQVATPATPPTKQSAFQDAVDEKSCFSWDSGLSPGGCLVQFSYYLLYVVPAFLLTVVAYFFNILISITLSSTLLKSAFISSAWAVVRDLSNLFFILILLYIAIKIILGLGGSEVKKMISSVIIMALLINFSMFFTQVVIDTSNILALVFYNKLSLVDKDGKTAPYTSITGEKDISGGLVQAFNPTASLTQPFFDQAKIVEVLPGNPPTTKTEETVPLGMMVGIILVTGLVLLFATYALFISGLSFVGRLIELFVLIIFSPFAFMSYTIPLLGHVDYIGWDAWFKRLLTVAFMAPIFMFFLYFIFMLTKANIFSDSLKSGSGIIIALLRMAIPAMVILVLLLQATKFAKKGSGAFGEAIMTGAKIVGGLALGAAVGGAAVAGRASIGRMGAAAANSKWAQRWESRGFGGEYFRRGAAAVGSGSFDVRGVKIAGKDLAGATGMKLGEAGKGGFTERRKAQVESRMKRAKELEVGEDNVLKQDLNGLEAQKQGLLMDVSHDIEILDSRLELWRKRAADAARAARADATAIDSNTGLSNADTSKQYEKNIQELNGHRNAIKNGVNFTPTTAIAAINPADVGHAQNYSTRTRVGGVATGASINELEDNLIPQARHAIQHENRRIRGVYADTTEGTLGRVKNALFSSGQSSYKGSREAAHKIRMETKIEDKGGGH